MTLGKSNVFLSKLIIWFLSVQVTNRSEKIFIFWYHRCFYFITKYYLHTTTSLGLDFPGRSASKESVCNVVHLGSIPGSRRSPGEGHGNPLQYSCLENTRDRGA